MAIKITQIKPEGAQKSAPSAKDYSGEKKGSSGSAVSGSSGRIQITKIPGAEKQRSIAASRKTTRETEHADELDKQTTPSASRQASKQTFGQRVLKGIESGLVSEGANLANLGGVATDRRGGTEMSGVYRRQAETLDKQIAALEKTLKDPTMTAQDIKETNEALAIARSEREKYGKVIESGEKTASSLYDTADKGYSFAQKLSEESTAGTKGIKKGALSIVPAATQIGLQTAERMVAPGMDVAGRALSVAGGNAADYRRKAGEQYDAEKATLRATVSALGVAAGGALSKGVNAAGLKLLRAAGKQNYVLPNIALGGASAVGYAAGETGASELSKAMTDEDYTPDWKSIGETALTAFAFGAISSAINAAAITGRNKKYMNELNEAAKERYDYAKRIIEDPRATAEQKAAGAQSVMDAVDKMRYTLDDLQVVGAQKEVDAMREFLLSIYGEMLPYTNVSAGGISTGASGLAPVAPVGGSIAPVQTGGGMSAMQENAPTAPISPRAPGAAAVMQNSTPAATPTARQQNTMPAQSAVTPESAQGMGEGNLTPTQPNAAQGAAEGKADALDEGKRVNLLEYSNEQNAQKVEDGLKDGTLAVDAKENIYRVNEDQHIDRRDSASVGERSVNAFQFDHPELHSYYADAAAVLQEEMSFAQKGGELIRRTSREAGDDEYIRTKRGVSERIARLLDDEGVRYDDIDRSLSAIIHNHGQENFAAAKRVELLLDDMLTNGYTDIHGQHIAPNEEYIAAKKAIPGADMSERTHEELPIYDMPEGRNGGIDNAGQETRNDAAGAELADAAERSTPGEVNAARALSDGAAERGERRGNGRESERIPREVRNVGGEDGNALTVQQRLTVSGISQFISPREANVPNGASSDNTVTIFDEADWDQELIGAADWAKSKGVKKVTALLGVIKVEKDGKTGRIFGAFNADTGEIFVNAGSVQRSVSETIEHETAHYLAEVARRENVKTFMRDVQSRYSSEEWGKVYDAYFDRYAALTGDYAGMSESDIELYVWEEIMGDAYAEIDQYDEKASRFNREAESALSQSGQESESALHGERALGAVEQGRETAAATERRRGPPEKYSVQRTQDIPYQEQIDAFYEGDLKTVGRSDDIYVTGADGSPDALGLGGKPFFMLKRNLQKITRKEGANKNYSAHGIGEDIIRDLPDMLKDPAMIIVEGDRISVIPGRTVDTAREKAAPLLIGVNPNGSVDGRSAYEIKTMYGREGFADWIGLRAKDSKIIAGNKNKATALLRNVGIKITEPVAYAADLTSAILSQSQGDVKSPTLGDEIHRQIMGEENEPSQMPPGNRVLKSSELQAKVKLDDSSVSDGGGNVKPKTRFSLDEPVEETKTLVAMHNMTEEKLRRTLDIGAWPAPSIAIVKAKDGHTNYGEYSAVFPRETIDPQRSSKNKVYGGDAWTPTRSNARVEYEVDQSKARALEREIDRLSSEFAGGAFQNSSVIGAAGVNEETELSLDDIAERLAKYPAVQAAYLQSKGESLEPVYKKKKFDSLGNDVLRQYIDRVGMQEVARLCAEMETGGRLDESALNAAREVIVDDWAKRNARLLERRAENRDKLIAVQKNRLEDWRIEKFIRNAEAYIEQNGTSGDEVDKEATSAKMYSMVAPGGSWGDAEKTVQQWVRPRLDGMLGKPGIYNGKDPYTENGRKPFKETHWDYTAENIVRAMNNASDRGEGMWGLSGGTLTATSVPRYESIDAIHADEERLRAESDDVHEKRLRDLDIEIDRVVDDLLRSTKAHSDSEYEERHILEDVLAEAAKGEHSPAAIKRSFAKDGYAIKDGNARSIMRLFDIAAKIPVGYFEAKPQRVVGFDEALAVVAPDDAPGDLLSEMRDAGMNVVEYRAGDDADRLDKINSIKNVRFSAEDEDGGEWDKELARMPQSVQEAVRRVKDERSKKPSMQEFPNLDAYLSGRSAQQAAESIRAAAENLKNGAEMKDAAREFSLDKGSRDLARQYADWLQTQDDYAAAKNVDRTKVENAIEKYTELYDKLYAAINDFLVAHGYEPIGFIKGYAPHFQPEAESGKLERALKAIGVDLGAEVGKLPASIAGLTKEFKPNKRYNPFFQHRNGKSTDYDIQKGFEKYVDYLSDVLYHTDDIMRTRAASKYFRKKYAPDEISAQIQQAEDLKFATAEEKELFLKTNGIIDSSTKMSYQAMNQAMEKYTDSLFDDVTQTTKYGDLVTWLDDYANKLAGKQLFNDRSMEREVGRMSLNVGRKLVSTFARANVAGNLSSALNQTAQLPMIAGELGPKYVAEAIGDITSGKARGDFADRSDFLTEKRGIRYLTSTKGDKFTAALFWPLERMDYLVSSIAVRGKYRKELAEGKSEKDALRAADRWGRDMMGSRSKGTAPLTFQSKNLISQMVNLFQVEALNSWEHVTQDLFGPGLREMEEKLGKKEASRRLAGIIVGTLLGAFILNRVDEELYGGTPAQFDVLGLLTGFLASGNGLSTNEQLGVWVDDVWQKMTGERLFGTDEDAGNDEFNLAAAAEDTIYNVSNDVPYVRNVSGLLGLGDQTLPMPDIYSTAKGIGSAVSDAASGDTEGFGSEIMRQLMGLVGDTVPGGRQVEKSVQGAGVIKNGGLYKGSGENKRLQYPAKPFLEDPWEALRAGLFGRNALSEARDFYAANDGGLSASQTRTYQELVDMGADREVIYDAIQKWRKIDKDDSLTDGEREAAQFELVRKLKLTNEQKERLHDDLSRSSRSYAAAQEAQKQGISAETYAEYKDATADLTADKDENGKAINGSKKAKVLDAIDKMQLSKKQKDWLYLDAGYSEKDIGKAPWNS